MATTFEQVWRKVALQASSVPPMLCRDYVQDAYQEMCTGRRWSFLRRSLQPATRASRGVTVTATQGSADLTAAVGQFVSTDLNRQIRGTNQGVPYTIIEVDAAAGTATLDSEYAGESGVAELTVLDAFLFMPEGFDGVRTLRNLTVQQPMPWWYTSEQLDFWDPNRIWGDATARIIAARGVFNGGGEMDGRQVYEWWPYPNAQAIYQMDIYAIDTLTDTSVLRGPLSNRGQVLETGALFACSKYPGTPEKPNPYFNAQLRETLRKEWEGAKQELNVRDEDQSPGEEFERIDWRWVQGLVPMDTHLLRSTDATVADYVGGGYTSGY